MMTYTGGLVLRPGRHTSLTATLCCLMGSMLLELPTHREVAHTTVSAESGRFQLSRLNITTMEKSNSLSSLRFTPICRALNPDSGHGYIHEIDRGMHQGFSEFALKSCGFCVGVCILLGKTFNLFLSCVLYWLKELHGLFELLPVRLNLEPGHPSC